MSNESTRVADVTGQDRQRDREARGIRVRPGQNSVAGRPSPPRRRRPAMAALAVILIVGGAAIAGLLAMRLDSRAPVLVLNQDVAVGTKITSSMLSSTDVASDKLMLVPEDQSGEVIGTYARTSLSDGQLLDTSMLTTAAPSASGAVRVGVPLTAGKVPAGLMSGDEVRIVKIGDGNNPPKPLAVGIVLSTEAAKEGGTLGGTESGSSATLLIPQDAADDVIDAAGNNGLGLALIKRGVAIDDADLTTLKSGS